MNSIDILVVDDNAVNVVLIEHVLALAGHSVRTAADAESALEMIDQAMPSLILLDLQLPGMDGYALAQKLRSRPDTARLSIVACSGCVMAEDRELASAAGCDGFIAKPIDTRRLPSMVASYLSTGRQACHAP